MNKIEVAFEQFKSMIKRSFCDHKEEDIIQMIRMPYGYNKCCFKCKKCGRERWS